MQAKINKFIKLSVLFLATTWLSAIFSAQKADLVIFSYNRPMQLYALLESTKLYVTGIDETHVIYRTATDNQEKAESYETGYQVVKQTFPQVIFHKQGPNPYADFKPLTLKATFESPSKYVIFAVDDIIVKSSIDLCKGIELMEKTNAYGFYYRLGLNIDYCYAMNKPDPAPRLAKIVDDIYAWEIKDGQHDWGYPNTVDMTLYRKNNIEQEFRTMNYQAPNPLEGNWSASMSVAKARSMLGLCHKESKIVNLPLNIVQNLWQNRAMHAISTKELLDKFNAGLKIDISQLHNINNKAAHMDYMPSFIIR